MRVTAGSFPDSRNSWQAFYKTVLSPIVEIRSKSRPQVEEQSILNFCHSWWRWMINWALRHITTWVLQNDSEVLGKVQPQKVTKNDTSPKINRQLVRGLIVCSRFSETSSLLISPRNPLLSSLEEKIFQTVGRVYFACIKQFIDSDEKRGCGATVRLTGGDNEEESHFRYSALICQLCTLSDLFLSSGIGFI